MKRGIGFLLRGAACCLLLAALAACGGSSGGGKSGLYKVRMMLLSNGTTPDVLEVQKAINEHIKDDGIELEFVIMDWSFPETIGLMVTAGEDLDLAPIWAWNISNDISQGKLLPITKYLTTTLKGSAEYEKDYLPAVTYKGEVYGLPTIRDMAQSFGICFREDILTKYGFNIKDIKTDADLEKVFEVIYPKEPDLTMLYTQGSGNSIMQQLHQNWDNLGDEYGVLMNWGQDIPFKVVDLFSQPTYEEQARLARKWYQNGWIVKDATTNPQGGALQIGAGKLVAFSSNLKPGFDAQSTLGAGGVKIVQSDFTPALATTTVVSLINWCMPITCKDPEKTSKFLERMYTDPVIWNLINWGIEGKHYKKLTNNIATYADGVDASNSGYIMNLTWFYGNSLMPGALMWEGNDDDVNARMLEFNRTAIKSKAFGFNFDTTPVRNATTAVANVVAEFRLALDDGLLDVDQNLPKFRQALKDAGIDDIIAEKQKQLDAWAHEQGLY